MSAISIFGDMGSAPAIRNAANRLEPGHIILLELHRAGPLDNFENRRHGPDRSRLDFSNFGKAVDVQGWGREVTTCGYGDLHAKLCARPVHPSKTRQGAHAHSALAIAPTCLHSSRQLESLLCGWRCRRKRHRRKSPPRRRRLPLRQTKPPLGRPSRRMRAPSSA